jgi:hypothetical protein
MRQNAEAILDALARVRPASHEVLVLMENGEPVPAKREGQGFRIDQDSAAQDD